MRLIEADALINDIMMKWGEDPKCFENYDGPTTGLTAFADSKALERINAAPASIPAERSE